MADETSERVEKQAVPPENPPKTTKSQSSARLFFVIGLNAAVVIIVITIVGLTISRNFYSPSLHLADDSAVIPSSSFVNMKAAGPFKNGVVAADNGNCSEIGRDIMKNNNGSAVDAAIATLFCVGVMNMHSAGIGGGGFIVIYNRTTNESKVFDFREEAPAAANETMYINSNLSSTFGASAVAVPGEIKGYLAVWRKYGSVPWKDLVKPAIELAWKGVPVNKHMSSAIDRWHDLINNSEALRELLQDENGEWLKLGDIIKVPKLAKTLERISEDPESFYTGSLAKDIVDDLKEGGGLIELGDMKSFTVMEREPQKSTLNDQYTWYSTPPPGSGAVLQFIINILKGFNMTGEDRQSDESSILTYHRITEAFKYAYGHRALLGDPAFNPSISMALSKLEDRGFAENLRKNINDKQTYNEYRHYADYFSRAADGGTTHVSIVDKDGNAVAATTTINMKFGSKFVGRRTGIIFNDEMDGFSTPGRTNGYDLEPSEPNYIRPGKRPLSSTSPSIFVDEDGDVKFVVGASGGPRITPAVAQAIMNFFWFERNITETVTDPRLHHQLMPMYIRMDENCPMPQTIIDGLRRLGHKVKIMPGTSVVQAVARIGKDELYGKSDPRKGGWAAGY